MLKREDPPRQTRQRMSRGISRGWSAVKFEQIRKAKGFTRGDLASLTGFHEETFRKWEVDGTLPQANHLHAAAHAMGLMVEDFVDIPAGERLLSDLRVFAGLKQPQVVAAVKAIAPGVKINTRKYSRIEGGQPRELTPDLADALARVFGRSRDEVEDAYIRSRNRPRGNGEDLRDRFGGPRPGGGPSSDPPEA